MTSKKPKLFGLIFACIFVTFCILFFVLGSLITSNVIPYLFLSPLLQSIFAYLMFLPLLLSLLFLGQHLKHKSNKYYIAYKILFFVSIALISFGLLQVLLTLFGLYQ